MKRAVLVPLMALAGIFSTLTVLAVDPPPPVITNITVSGSQRSIRFDPYPAAQAYTILSGTNLALPLTANTDFFQAPYILSSSTNGTNYAYEWRITNNTAPAGL